VAGALTHISLLSDCFTASSSVAKECDQLAVYEPFERNGVAEWEKLEIDFCILTETCGMCLVDFGRTMCCNRCCRYTVKPLSVVFLCVVFHSEVSLISYDPHKSDTHKTFLQLSFSCVQSFKK
jgi:hypothetical protein